MRDLMNMKAPTGETPAADEAEKDAVRNFDYYQVLRRRSEKNSKENRSKTTAVPTKGNQQ